MQHRRSHHAAFAPPARPENVTTRPRPSAAIF